MSLLPPDVGRTDKPGMEKSHEVYGRFDRAKKALCAASSKGKEAVMEAAKEFLIAKDEYDKLPNRHGILGGRRRKTRRSRRRKTRGGVETNPKGSPNGFGASGTAALAALAGRSAQQQALADTSGITGLPRVTEDPNENADSTSTRRKKEQRESVSGLFGKKGARRTRRRR